MVMNISCKFEKASYNIFFVRAATVKSVDTQAKNGLGEVLWGLWMTFNEELQGQISACLQRTYICITYTSHRMI